MPPNQQNPYNQPPQQNAQGGYDVVPPLPGAPSAAHSGHNPYEFIVNPQNAPKRSLFSGGSLMKPVLAIVAIVIVLVVIIAVVTSLLAPKGPTAGLTAIAQRQREIVRVATAATQTAQSQDTKNFVENVQVDISSGQTQVVNYLASHGTKLKDKQLALDQSAQTDSTLANAQTSNTYDRAVTSNLLDQLATYQGQLQSTYKATANSQLKQTLQQAYNATSLLLDQGKALQR